MLPAIGRYVRQHHVGLIAVFIALGGSAYAASLPRNSVGTAQLKRGAVVTKKVKDRSLLARDFKSGQLPAGSTGIAGPQGPIGPGGPQGPPGPATGAAGGDLAGSYPNPTIGEGKVTAAHLLDGATGLDDLAAALKDGDAGAPCFAVPRKRCAAGRRRQRFAAIGFAAADRRCGRVAERHLPDPGPRVRQRRRRAGC